MICFNPRDFLRPRFWVRVFRGAVQTETRKLVWVATGDDRLHETGQREYSTRESRLRGTLQVIADRRCLWCNGQRKLLKPGTFADNKPCPHQIARSALADVSRESEDR